MSDTETEALCRDIRFVLDSPAFFAPDAPTVARTAFRTQPPPLQALEIPLATGPECLDDAYCRMWHQTLLRTGGEGFLEDVARVVAPTLPHLGGRLGLLFEQIVFALLRRGQETVLTDTPVREGQGRTERTLGAFDALVLNSERVEHWEMAVKFYLQTHPSSEWHHCVGPGTRDRLDLKGTKTFLQQLPLSSTPRGREVLRGALVSCGVSPTLPLHMRAFTKGTVFYRWPAPWTRAQGHAQTTLSASPFSPNEAWRASVVPKGLAPNHAKRWWIAPADAPALRNAFPDALLAPLPRLRWLGGVSPKQAVVHAETWEVFLGSLAGRLEDLQGRSECLLASVHEPREGKEISRGFFATPRFLHDAGIT
ncbi:MAG: DUF1853 family protein [Silvanigrellales bacterium]|nr:DUF1853 family protein [Silvanigrellales bacterium]